MILATAQDFVSLFPNFMAGCKTRHDQLVLITFILSVVGLMLSALTIWITGNISKYLMTLVRMAICIIMVIELPNWWNQINDAVTEIVNNTGFYADGGNPGGVFQDYLNAIRKKFGTDSAAQGNKQLYDSAKNRGTVDTVGNPSVYGGPMITHYAYPGDSTPDWNSSHGIGNHDNKLVAGRSLALSKNIADTYGFMVGETISVTMADGRNFTGTYDDTVGNDPNTGQPLQNRIDIYDPENQYANLSGTGVTGLNGLGVQDTGDQNWGGKVMGWITGFGKNTPDMLTSFIIAPILYILSLGAVFILWVSSGIIQILAMIEIAISPIFIGLLMVPSLVSIASRFFLSFVALAVIPISYAICDLITKWLVDAAVNPTSNTGHAIVSAVGTSWGIWVALIIWVAGSSVFAPIMTFRILQMGHSGLSVVLGATASIPARVNSQANSMYRSAVLGAGAMRAAGGALGGGAGAKGSSPIGLPSSSNGSGGISYAVRPGFQTQPAAKP
jgi:hypothetical protein